METSKTTATLPAPSNQAQATTDAHPRKKSKGGSSPNDEAAAQFAALMAALDPSAASQVSLSPEGLQAAEAGKKPASAPLELSAEQKPQESAEDIVKLRNSQDGKAEAAMAAAAQKGGAEALVMRQINAERAKLTQNAGAGEKTGQAIAGLQPWRSEWVMSGNEPRDLQTLIKEGTPKGVGRGEAGTDARMLALENLEAQIGLIEQKIAGVEAGMPQAPGPITSNNASVTPESLRQAMGAGPQYGQTAVPGMQAMMVPGAKVSQAAIPSGGLNGSSSLSGAEFMQTLQGVQSQNSGQSQGGQNGMMGGQGQGQESGQGSGQMQSPGMGRGGLKKGFGLEDQLKALPREGAADLNLVAPNSIAQAQPSVLAASAVDVTGHVVKGTMSRDRLSSESLAGITTGLRDIGANGGGEMRIRLNPDNLGELHVKVSTSGNHVSLQIQASDGSAKKVIEESMGYLKDSLASHSMTLGKVDVSVASAHSSHYSGGGFDHNDPSQAGRQWDANSSAGQDRGNRAGWERAEEGVNGRMRSAIPQSGLFATAPVAARRASAYTDPSNGTSRIDVMA